MRFTVTALGAAGGRSAGAVAARIVEYLQGGTPGPEQRRADGGRNDDASPPPGARPERNGPAQDPARYYADSGERPGWWLGTGAGTLGLQGDVDPDVFRSVLSGRHPGTGERLISARGSSGRVAELGAGTAAAVAPDGEALYSLADVATVLGWSRMDAAEAAAEGLRLAAEQLFAALVQAGAGRTLDSATVVGAPEPGTAPGPAGTSPTSSRGTGRGIGMALVPVVDRDGTVFVRGSELDRVEALVNESRGGKLVDGTADAGEVVSGAEAARLIGASTSYVARLCRTWEAHSAEIVEAAGTESPSRRAYIEATRSATGGWLIRREDLAAFVERRRQPAVRVGYDVTATTEKSLSVLALLGGPEVRAEVLAAIEAANDTGIGWLERHAACARAGKKVLGVEGWTAASFQHLTSRRLDPFVHHHNVVANTVVDEHGVRRALDARRLYQRVAAGSAIATAQVRWELVSRLGVGFRPARHGGWEIDGIDDGVIDEFSSRIREIRETINKLEDALGRTTTMAEFQAVVAGSRPTKRAAEEDVVVAQWWARARARGLRRRDLARCVSRRRPPVMTARRRARILEALGRAVTEQRSVFTRVDVLSTLVDMPDPTGSGPVVLSAAALEALTDEFLVSDRVVRLQATSGRRDRLARQDGKALGVGGAAEPEFSTTEILAVQARALRDYRDGAGTGHGTVPGALVAEALGRFPGLSGEQAHMVASFCTSGDVAQSGIGRPGTGKSYAMRAAVAAWEAAGYRVLGAAVKAEAARHLGDECGIPAEPLAWYLNRLDDPARSPLDDRTVLIVDEASTVGDRALGALVGAAHRDRAALRLIGDPAQHGSVNAGGLWRVNARQHADRTPELVEGRRVRHAGDRAAAEALRDGYAEVALAELEAAGHLHVVADDRELYTRLLARWWDARQAGAPHPMVDRRNDQRLILNRLARAMRRHRGELGEAEIVATADRRYAVGDEVTARMGDRALHPAGEPDAYVRNGAHGVVTAVARGRKPAADRLEVAFSGLGTISVPRSFFDEHTDRWGRTDVGIDHAYAVTSYAVEGLTFDESSSHVDPRSTRPEVYVDITRGRNANHVFVTSADDHLDGERLPAVPAPGVDHQLRDRLDRAGGEPVAIDLDPGAGTVALARLSGTAPAPVDDEADVARRAQSRPDPAIAARLGGEPSQPYLADRYRELIGDTAVYRHRWRPRPGRRGPWAWALGQPAAGGEDERAALVERLSTYTVDVARHRLGHPIDPDGSSAVAQTAADGWFGHIDFDLACAQLAAGAPVRDALGHSATQGQAPAATQEPIGVG